MAIYHFSANVISRSQGRSSVAASAYRSGEKLHDDKTDHLHDFSHKSDVIKSEILCPNNAPDWMRDRGTLWNAVEATEKRKDAQLSRDITIALPKELTPDQNWSLAKAFVNDQFVKKGMVADMNFHRGHKGSEDQPHVHVMLTMRAINGEGFGKKVRAWNDKTLLKTWRERWAEYCNRDLARHGIDQTIDHRTLEDQGINLEPQNKIGARANVDAQVRAEEHKQIAKRNGERLLADPAIALTALTHQQSTFTHRDMARFVHRHSDGIAQFQQVYETVKQHPDLIKLGRDDNDRERFTTKDMLAIEQGMIAIADKRSQLHTSVLNDAVVTEAIAERTLSNEQQHALRHVTQGASLTCVVGYAGTGKSYLLGAAKEAWETSGYNVQGMTLSGIAAENLTASAGITSHTVANRLICWANDRQRLTKQSVVVVDEAGMLGSRQMAEILQEVDRAGAKAVLVGDPEQLQAIQAGGAFRAIAERVGTAEMTEVRRQQVAWQCQATQDFACQRTVKALLAYDTADHIHEVNTQAEAITALVDRWEEGYEQSPDTSHLLLAFTRDEVLTLNRTVRARRQARGELTCCQSYQTARGQREFAIGDRLYCLRNDRDLGVKNGTLGTLVNVDEKTVTLALDGRDRCISIDLSAYNALDYGYASTVHKAQGITVDRSYILASRFLDSHSTYTAMSRHRLSADIYFSREQFAHFGELGRLLSRERTKDVTLDYALSRGIAVPSHRHQHDRFSPPIDRPVLTDAQDKAANERIDHYQKSYALQHNIEEISTKLGQPVRLATVHETGEYCGRSTLCEREYAHLQGANNEVLLTPFCDSAGQGLRVSWAMRQLCDQLESPVRFGREHEVGVYCGQDKLDGWNQYAYLAHEGSYLLVKAPEASLCCSGQRLEIYRDEQGDLCTRQWDEARTPDPNCQPDRQVAREQVLEKTLTREREQDLDIDL